MGSPYLLAELNPFGGGGGRGEGVGAIAGQDFLCSGV